MFDTTKTDLRDILRDVDEGRLQLPDFQRDYVWADDDVRSLIASVARGFPVGALLTLETGGPVQFKPRLLEGVPSVETKPEELLLDGQQRMTSLYQAMFSQSPVKAINSGKKRIDRYYYLDIQGATEGIANFEDAIVGVPADRVLRKDFGRQVVLDVSSRELEYESGMFPLNMVFECMPWLFGWREYCGKAGRDLSELEQTFYRKVIDPITRYKMPVIRLDRENSREAICLVFEKVNVGGKKLDAFELVTAIYAASQFDLREDWRGTSKPLVPGRKQRMVIGSGSSRREVLSEVGSTDFLQACTLLHTRQVRLDAVATDRPANELPQVTCRRDALLDLPLDAYRKHADAVEQGFVEASGFLNELGILRHYDVPYPPLLVALASTYAIVGDRPLSLPEKHKLEQWLWAVTLGELYGSSTESRMARDVPELVEWIRADGPRPRSIDDAVFQQERFRTLRSRLSAAYKGIHALLMKQGCQDFMTGRKADIMTFFDDNIDIHHIFPQKWCAEQHIEPSTFNSVINKTPLSRHTNIVIGGDAPSKYLRAIEEKTGIAPADLDELLRTHLIEPAHLRNDDFEGFFAARREALSSLVSTAMGKQVVLEQSANEPEEETPADPQEFELEFEEVV